jgi:hypothetical protein
MPEPDRDTPAAPATAEAPRTATLRQAAGAVFWSFFGVRKGSAMERDAVTLKPHHVVIIGLLSGVMFVLVLVALVTYITRNAP